MPVPSVAPPQRLAFTLKPAAERQVKKRHPWVFEASIVKQNAEGRAGDLAVIFDQKKNKFLACGLYDPHSPIRIKLLQFHRSATIDGAWLRDKIRAARDLRRPLLRTDTNSYRLVYGENDGLPGLIADVYDRVLVVKLYSAIWWPYWEWLLPALREASEASSVVLRLSRHLQRQVGDTVRDGEVVYGELPAPRVRFREHGLWFSADVQRGHKTGYFLDHRHNRLRIGQRAAGKRVLDVFAYAGGFSVHALVGGAREVTSLDLSAPALEMARQNAALNPHRGRHQILLGDAFESLAELVATGQRYDIVVIDPPAFAKQASEVGGALEQYRRLAGWGAQLVAKDGLLLLASCSSRVSAEAFFAEVERGLQRSQRKYQILERTYHDLDHPVRFAEGAYLKAIYFSLR